jgi:hypothetical protein
MSQLSGWPTVILAVQLAGDPWQPLVGIGTLALAVATAVLAGATFRMVRWTRKTAEAALEDVRASALLARSAGDQAKASQASADAAHEAAQSAAIDVELSRRALETQVRPIIVDVATSQLDPKHTVRFARKSPVTVGCYRVLVSEDNGFVHCSIPARNVGAGTAFIRGLGISISPDFGWSGKISLSIVAPGESTRTTFSIPKSRVELRELASAVLTGTFSIELRYTDINGGQDTITRLDVHNIGSSIYVRQVSLLKPGDSEPFASSGPADL